MVKRNWLLASLALWTAVAVAAPPNPAAGLDPGKLLTSIQSPALKAQHDRLKALQRQAVRGEFELALKGAETLPGQINKLAVVQEDIHARTLLRAYAFQLQGDLYTLLGRYREAQRAMAQIQALAVPTIVKAVSLQQQGLSLFYARDYAGAVQLERRARQLDRERILPVLEAARNLYSSSASRAARELRELLGKGPYLRGHAYLFAAAASGVNGDLDDALGYWETSRSDTSYSPLFYSVGGLLRAAHGDLKAARATFAAGVQREQGTSYQLRLLAAVSEMAVGDTEQAAQALRAMLSKLPSGYARLAQDLLAQPSAKRAQVALQRTGYWFSQGAYRSGDLLLVPAAEPQPEPPPAAVEPAPVVPATPANTIPPPPEPAPTVQPAAAPAAAAPERPVSINEPNPEWQIEEVTYYTSAVKAYDSALWHIRANRMEEAEASLTGAVDLVPGLYEAWLMLGQVRLQRGHAAGAAVAYRRALTLRPSWADAAYGTAVALDQTSAAQARPFYEAALRLGLADPLAAYARQRLAAPVKP